MSEHASSDGFERGNATLLLRLRRITWEAPGVLSLEFVSPTGGDLPPFEPGAHVDLHLPDGAVRQYSLCGDPAERTLYRLGVREIEGGRGSRAIHRDLRPGALTVLGAPRSSFAFGPAPRYLFVAGGIGITPLLPMMREATRAALPWSLLFCVRRREHAPFLGEALAMGGDVSLHASEDGSRLDVAVRLAEVPAGTSLYCCGPDNLMRAVEEATRDWPAGSVHFEWFKARDLPPPAASPGAFELVLARTGLTILVPPELGILDALAAHGIDVPRSCEQGVCGTCECPVLDGEVDHRDSLLSASERLENRSMMVCVSRAKGSRLVLDL